MVYVEEKWEGVSMIKTVGLVDPAYRYDIKLQLGEYVCRETTHFLCWFACTSCVKAIENEH